MAAVRTIAVTNQKGGVGKTTTVANLGAALARRGVKVCLIDLDPQAHLTMHFGIDPSGLSYSMYDVLTSDLPLSRATRPADTNLTLVPSVIDLAAAEVELAGAVGREQILADRIAAEDLGFDLIMADCPPSLSLLTLNALAAVREVFIPLQPHFLALQGLGKLLETVSLVQRRINAALRVGGIVFCLYETSTRLAAEVIEDVRSFFASARESQPAWSGTRIFETRIRRNIKLAECPSYGTTIQQYDPSSRGAADYAALCEEFLACWPSESAPAHLREVVSRAAVEREAAAQAEREAAEADAQAPEAPGPTEAPSPPAREAPPAPEPPEHPRPPSEPRPPDVQAPADDAQSAPDARAPRPPAHDRTGTP